MRHLSKSALSFFVHYIFFVFLIVANFPIHCVYVVKKCPKLKSRYKHRVEAVVEYAKTIDNFDVLVNP